MNSLAMRITNKKIKFWYVYGRKFAKYLHGTWTCFCGPGSQLFLHGLVMFKMFQYKKIK